MGNSATKEQRVLHQPRSTILQHSTNADTPASNADGGQVYGARHGFSSRTDLSTLLRLGGPGNRDNEVMIEPRRETRAEREARRLEKDRINREKERARSLREESIDGGYLVTHGVYTGLEDFNKPIVRQLMIERRLAPFWRGLNDHSDAWTEPQLVAVVRGQSISAEGEVLEDSYQHPAEQTPSLMLPIASRTVSHHSDSSVNRSPPSTLSTTGNSASASSLLRGRAKTLASLSTSLRGVAGELTPKETQLLEDPSIDGEPVEACLYKDAMECPICFLYYPASRSKSLLNRTRCCDQPICSECFVQIKRPNPHPPEHTDAHAPPASEGQVDPESFVSEPASCPFCKQPEFGVTYDPPPFRRGVTYVNQGPIAPLGSSLPIASAMSSSSSLGSSKTRPLGTRRRTASLSVNASSVITTDRIRPDWASKLASARAHAARRSAAATALHTAAYLIGHNGASDSRPFAGFARRVRRSTEESPASSSAHLNVLAMMTDQLSTAPSHRTTSPSDADTPLMQGPPRLSSRRNRIDDLEDMMMMEAIRLSLASEEERRKKEEKNATKVEKKRVKDEKKAERTARKAGLYSSSANHSASTLESSRSGSMALDGKGKNTARDDLLSIPGESLPPAASTAFRPSHLRNLSNVSNASSVMDSAIVPGSTSSLDVSPSTSGVNIIRSTEPFTSGISPVTSDGAFNFQSLAAMIGDVEKIDIGPDAHASKG